jgi:hypothetical protein
MSEPKRPSGLSGLFAIGLVVGLWLLACCWPTPQRFGVEEQRLVLMTWWGSGMAVAFGVSLNSVRHGPDRYRSVAYAALTISLLSIVGVLLTLHIGLPK